MPFPFGIIACYHVGQIQHGINGDGSQSSFLVVLSWILHRRHPLHAIIRYQAILPLHAATQSVFRCKPLTQRTIQSKCHTLRYHLTKIATVRVHQTHVHARLYKPVVPNPVRKHRKVILHFCIFKIFNFPQLHLGTNTECQVAVAIRSCTSIRLRLLSYESATSHDISDIPIHAPPVTQSIRVQQTDACQQRAFAYTKVIVDANSRIQTRVPFPFWTIHAKQVMQIQQRITIHSDVTTFAAILTRLIKWRQPVSMPILQQGQFVFPVKLAAHTHLMGKPLAYRQVQSERFSIGEHLRKVISIWVLQRHVQSHLHKPVLPEPFRSHRSRLLCRLKHLCLGTNGRPCQYYRKYNLLYHSLTVNYQLSIINLISILIMNKYRFSC